MLTLEFLNNIDTTNLLLSIFIILVVLLIAVIVALFGKKFRENLGFKKFLSYAKQKGLNEEEAKILWKYSKQLDRDPFLSLEIKAAFEKAIDLYVKSNPNYNERLATDMRKKLGFDLLFYFMPLVSTKDIEIFQGGTLTTANGTVYEVALYDKDERFMYWLLIDVEDENIIHPKDRIKINLVRKNDAVYNFSGKVSDVIKEDGKVILKIPHTFDMVRIQRRQYVRVETDFYGELITPDFKKLYGKIADISIGGVRFCTRKEEIPPNLNLTNESSVKVRFQIGDRNFEMEGIIKTIIEKRRIKCYGIQFTNISEPDEQFIANFIKNEQKKLYQLCQGKR